MAKMVMTQVLCVVVACMVVVAPYAEVITCGQVAATLAPCMSYLTKGGSLPPACCGAVKGLNGAANSTPARQTVCGCLKNIYAATQNVNLGSAGSLPGKCGVNIPYKINPTTDCTKVT